MYAPRSSDSIHVASASDDHELRIWDAKLVRRRGRCWWIAHCQNGWQGRCVNRLKGHTNFVCCVNFNPQSNLLVSGSFDESVRIWDVKSGRLWQSLMEHFTRWAQVGAYATCRLTQIQ